jgi:hypothetical protein
MRQLRQLKGMRRLQPVRDRSPEFQRRHTQRHVPATNKGGKTDQRIHVRRTVKDFPSPTPQPTQCRLWQGALDKYGYGTMKRYINGKRYTYKVHRWTKEAALGRRLKPTEAILHLCDNRLCYRVDHLKVGTIQDNNADMFAKGRAVKPPRISRKGAENPQYKWTPEKLDLLRRRLAEGAKAGEIALEVGLHQATVYRQIKQLGGTEKPSD